MKKLYLIVLSIWLLSFLLSDDYKFVTFEYPPLEFSGKDNKVEGIAVEMIEEIMNNLGHTVEIEIYPWARSLLMVKEGKADAIFTAYKNEEREKFLDYSENALIPQIVVFYKRKGDNIHFNGDLLELKDKRIGILNTISYGSKFDSIKDELMLFRVENFELNFIKLKSNIVDLVICNVYQGEYILQELGMQDEFDKIDTIVQHVDSYIAFSKQKKLTELRISFDKEFMRLKENGTYLKIMKKYGINICN